MRPDNWKELFLAALNEIPVRAYAARAAGVDRSTAWRHEQSDKDFAKAVDDAMEGGVDRAEAEMFRRGVVGYEEPVVHQGNLTPIYERDKHGDLVLVERRRTVPDVNADSGKREVIDMVPVQAKDGEGRPMWLTVRKHSDSLLTLALKGRRKAYSTERQEHTSPDGTMSPVDESTRAARVAQLMASAKARKAAQDAAPDFSDIA